MQPPDVSASYLEAAKRSEHGNRERYRYVLDTVRYWHNGGMLFVELGARTIPNRGMMVRYDTTIQYGVSYN